MAASMLSVTVSGRVGVVLILIEPLWVIENLRLPVKFNQTNTKNQEVLILMTLATLYIYIIFTVTINSKRKEKTELTTPVAIGYELKKKCFLYNLILCPAHP